MPKIIQYLDWRTWLRGLWTSGIKGGTGALIGTGGLLAGYLAGVDVKPLDYKQIGGVFLGAAVAHLIIYLNANPAPLTADQEENISETPPAK